MALGFREITQRAIEFSRKYENARREISETQSFYNDFFHIFGIERRRVATFEEPARKLDGGRGRIDLFWRGILLIEQKSAGGNLENAKQQAMDYLHHMPDHELPRYILVSDFQQFELYDLVTEQEDDKAIIFSLAELHKNIQHFGFIAGYTKRVFKEQEPVDIQAGELMGLLHDRLVENGYHGIELEQLLIRLLFCLFAEDTSIFAKDEFRFYIEEQTKPDGSDLGAHIAELFQTLNIAEIDRQSNLSEALHNFPYINGDLFQNNLQIPAFNRKMREQLLQCCGFDWSQISPAIFGAIFQAATNQLHRRYLGAHYTSEKNILKIIKPLFLDELWQEFDMVKSTPKKLQQFHIKLSKLTFLDPACGCGNFLIVAYRELRLLEIEVLKLRYHPDAQYLNINDLPQVTIHQFYGIELEELPSKIAELALWLVDHQMNMLLGQIYGAYFSRIPLTSFRNITIGNALRLDWEAIIAKNKLSYILGNPPFIGKDYQTPQQKDDMRLLFSTVSGAGILDYVTAWYIKAASLIQNSHIKVGFVATNSITQGEQVAILWQALLRDYHIHIHFAHRTFSWNNEARGNAAVHCVIIGFAAYDTQDKLLYDYQDIKGEPQENQVTKINPYLIEADDILVVRRSKHIDDSIPRMNIGSKPTDNGCYLFTATEKEVFLQQEPNAVSFFRPFLGAYEFINNIERHCLWLKDANPSLLKKSPHVMARIQKVREYREKSKDATTRKDANIPTIFQAIRQPSSDYLLIPCVSSEIRNYVPMGYVDKHTITSNACMVVPDASLYHFGILTSAMHHCWMRHTAGRLESRYRYSAVLVYNNFIWPQKPSAIQQQKIADLAQNILDARADAFALHEHTSLADLYHPLTMPKNLLNAHHALDKEVDKAYGKQRFKSERERIEYLFGLYHAITAPLDAMGQKKTGKR